MNGGKSFQIRNPEDVFSDMYSKFTNTFTEDEIQEIYRQIMDYVSALNK